MQKNSLFRAQSRNGFTLIELIVAVSIFLLVIVAASGVEIQSIRVAATNKHNLQAAALAQQALNLTRTIRDNNLLTDSNNPFANMPAGEYCLKKDSVTKKMSLKAYNGTDCTNPNPDKIVNLDNTNYDVKITVEE